MARIKPNSKGFYYHPENAKENYISKINREQITATGRNNVAIFDHVLINNYYSDPIFILSVIFALLIKIFFLKKSYFVNKTRNYEYEYYLINFGYCGFILGFVFLNNIKVALFLLSLPLFYLLYLYRKEISEFIKSLNTSTKDLNIDVGKIKIEEEREIIKINQLNESEMMKANIEAYSVFGSKIFVKLLKSYLKIFFDKFFKDFIFFGTIVFAITLFYLLFILIGMYNVGLNEYFING